jgi:hypothetical protein
MTLESLETTRTMIFVAIFSAEKDGGMKTRKPFAMTTKLNKKIKNLNIF